MQLLHSALVAFFLEWTFSTQPLLFSKDQGTLLGVKEMKMESNGGTVMKFTSLTAVRFITGLLTMSSTLLLK